MKAGADLKLKDLIEGYKLEIIKGDIDVNITGIEHDSRKIQRDNMFIAIEGFTVDGHDYIDEAVERGASCILVQKDVEVEENGVTVIKVDDTYYL